MSTTVPAPGRPSRADRLEGVALVLIVLAVAGMAGAASFRHVHDWTMHNSPAGTGDWFGWANAMVSELIPLAAGLEIRRRRRLHLPIGRYPIAIVVGAVLLSLTGQFAEARASVSGWIISAVPAVGFLALAKLALSRPSAPVRDEPSAAGQPAGTVPANDTERPAASPAGPATGLESRINGYAIGTGVAR